MMKSLLRNLNGFTLLLLSSGVLFSQELPDTIDRVRASIVAIGTVKGVKSPQTRFLGTGFVVGNGRQVITNLHVLPENLDAAEKERLAVFTGRGRSGKARRAEITESDSVHDLALLKIWGGRLPALKLDGSSGLREGTEVAFTGFPIGMVLGLYPVTHKGIVSAVTPIVIPAHSSKQLTAKMIKRMRRPFEVYQLDAIAYPGSSGSPVYEPNTGRVVGVVNSVFVKGTKESVLTQPSAISYAIPVKYIWDIVNNRQ